MKVFCTAAEHLSFHKTAKHLFLTQPAETQQVKALEVNWAAVWPHAEGPFPDGARLAVATVRARAAALAAEAAAKLALGDIVGEFAQGVSTTIAQCVLPRGRGKRKSLTLKVRWATWREKGTRRRAAALQN